MKTLVDTGAAVTILQEDLLARVSRKETQVRPVTMSVQDGEAGVLEPTLSFEERYKAGILKVTIKDGRYQFGCSI